MSSYPTTYFLFSLFFKVGLSYYQRWAVQVAIIAAEAQSPKKLAPQAQVLQKQFFIPKEILI